MARRCPKRPLHKHVLRPAAMAGHMGSNKITTRRAALIDLLTDGRPRTREAVWQQAAGQLDDDCWGKLPQETLARNRRDPYRSVRRQRPLTSVSSGTKRSGWPPPHPTTANGRNGHKPQPVANGTAASAPAQPTVNGNGRANLQRAAGLGGLVGLAYGDGTAVDQHNQPEVDTFQSCLAARRAAPASTEALPAY